jgi:DNA-directed RNA polymerase
MLETQRELESLLLSEAAAEFWRRFEGRLNDIEKKAGIEARSKSPASLSKPGAQFISQSVRFVAERIRAQLDAVQTGKGGRVGSNIDPFLCARSLEGIAYLALKEIVDRGCRNVRSGNPELFRYDVIINAIGRNVPLELEACKQKNEKDPLPAVARLNEAIRREAKKDERRKLVRQKRNLLSRLAKVDFNDECRARIGLVLYRALLDANLIREHQSDGEKITMQLADEVLTQLAEDFDSVAGQKPRWGPLVAPPRRWTNNRDGGYHFDLRGKHELLKVADRDFCEEKAPEVFSAVNTLQSVAFRINRKILDTAKQLLSTIPTRETDELFGISPAVSEEKRLWLRVSVNRITADANRLAAYPKIYYAGFLDFRGRYYCKTTYLNPQGSDLCRGLIEFADAKPIRDDKAERWLRNHGASCYGSELARGTHDEREQWVRDNEARIVALAHDPLSPENRTFLEGADKPWVFLAWSHEWSGFREKGFGYESRLPVAVDGSCNGIQHFAALMRSRTLAEQVNLSKTIRPGDIYKAVADGTERMFRERHNAMTWYASLTLDEVVEKYKDYTRRLSRRTSIIVGGQEDQGEPIMAAREADDEAEIAEEFGEDSDEEDVEEFEDGPGKTGVYEESVGELENMEAVLKEKWDDLSRNKRMECLQECRRQLAEGRISLLLRSAVVIEEAFPDKVV